MLCRNVESAHTVAREITKDTGHQVDVIKMNLASLQSVKNAAKELLEKQDKIDILINNAGMYQNMLFISENVISKRITVVTIMICIF